jgi:HK97 gp10 family phage protein
MSIELQLNIQGSEAFAQALNRLDAEMQAQVQRKLADWATQVQTTAKRLVPVRTGYLQSTIFSRVQQWQAEVGAEATYAASVEFGSRNSHAQPFIQPALDQHLPELERFLLDALDSAASEAAL